MVTTISNCLFIKLLTLVSLLGAEIVYARFISSKHKAVAKTINDERVIIDCVDIHNQPAFRHPLLRNHTIQMNPVSNLKIKQSQATKSREPLVQSWTKYGECPEGTVPISRTHMNVHPPRAVPPKKQNELTDANNHHEFAVVKLPKGAYFGAHASINVWNPKVENGEASFSKIWVIAGQDDNLNSIEAGWMVYPDLYASKTTFFVSWTNDGHNKTGCYNLECPGFVQVNRNVVPGASLEPMSVYNGNQYEVSITIYKEYSTGNWWVNCGGAHVGYFPPSLFSILATKPADVLSWGGDVYNLNRHLGQHTTTQMGSGHFSSEGSKKASFFKQLRYLDKSGIIFDPKSFEELVTNPTCYDLRFGYDGRSGGFGRYFYYGGPGFSDQCH